METTKALSEYGRQMLESFLKGNISQHGLAAQLIEHLFDNREADKPDGVDHELYAVDLVLHEIRDGFREQSELLPTIQQVLSECSPISS